MRINTILQQPVPIQCELRPSWIAWGRGTTAFPAKTPPQGSGSAEFLQDEIV